MPHLRLPALLAAWMVIAAGLFAVGCVGSSDGNQDSPRADEVTVPDNISALESQEVERRLNRLLGVSDPGSQAAPVADPTEPAEELTLEELLALIGSATPAPTAREMVFSISPRTLSTIVDPVLAIKTEPAHGTASVKGPNQIVYIPGEASPDGDSFEYELFDGARLVFSQVVEIR